jgi:hypothetical protein
MLINPYILIKEVGQFLTCSWEYSEIVHQLFIDFKKACDSVRREVLYNILIVWGTHETNPCGGGVEYLHRDPASRKRRRNGTKKGRAIA